MQAIATAHDATVTARAQPTGGLDIVVRFPVAPSPGADLPHPPPVDHVRGVSVPVNRWAHLSR